MDTDPAAAPDTVEGYVHPATGELVDPTLDAMVAAAYAADRDADELGRYRRALSAGIARELDRAGGKRKATLELDLDDGPATVEVEVNPPTTEEYLPDVLLAELEPVIEAGRLNRAYALGELVYRPAPKTPPPRKVSKTELNKLKKSDDGELLAAIARARIVQPTTRTAKVKRAR